MKAIIYFILYLVLAVPLQLFAQGTCDRLQFCSHAASGVTPAQILAFINLPSRDDLVQNIRNAQTIVNRILCISNSSADNIRVQAAPCANAVAVICTDKKYILFSTDYLLEVMESGDSSAIYGIFAHEVGHLTKGDAWLGGDKKQRHKAELNADKFAGHILGLLSFSQETAKATLYAVNEYETETHPSKNERIPKIIEGWQQGTKNRDLIINKNSIEYIKNCKSDLDSPFKIEHNTSESKRGRYKVTCHISGDSARIMQIKRITYYLHPYTFKNNFISYDYLQNLFLNIWGSFELRVSIICEEDGLLNEYITNKSILVGGEGKGAIDSVFIEDTNIKRDNLPVTR